MPIRSVLGNWKVLGIEMSHCLSHKNESDRMLRISPFCPPGSHWHRQDSAHCAKPSFLTAHAYDIWGSLQSRHSTQYGENAPVEKQYHRNLIYCSYSPWQQIIMLEICGEQGSDRSSVGDPYDSKKYDQILLFLFQTVCTFCHSCFKNCI